MDIGGNRRMAKNQVIEIVVGIPKIVRPIVRIDIVITNAFTGENIYR